MITLLPAAAREDVAIEKIVLDEHRVLGTCIGLKRDTNEDRLGLISTKYGTRICITDGHWGEEAAQTGVDTLLDDQLDITAGRGEAVGAIKAAETKLYDKYGKPNMDEAKDFTSETSLLAVEIADTEATVVSYGDARLLVVRDGSITYNCPTHPTWLGAFSRLGLRSRTSVEQTTVYDKVALQKGDIIIVFTDGIDECVYETPTISFETLAEIVSQEPPEAAFDIIMDRVFAHGAEDNASLAIIRI